MIIPIKTVWSRGQPEPAAGELIGKIRFTFDLPINPFGMDRIRFDRRVDVAGFTILVHSGEWRNGKAHLITTIDRAGNNGGETATAIPIGLIVGALAIIGIGAIGIAVLSKVERVVELPAFPILAAVVAIIALPKLIKGLK